MLKAILSRKELSSISYYDCVSDIISSFEVEQLKYITHHITTTRFQHCVNVSYYSYMVCCKLRLDARSAARAGMLHDLFFYDRKEYNSSREKGQLSHSCMHSAVAVMNASRVTKLSELERDIIEKHMWPVTRKKPKFKESYVITFVDKYCAALEFLVPKIVAVRSHVPFRSSVN